MANLFIRDETKAKLDIIAKQDKRGISHEVDFLVDERAKQLGVDGEQEHAAGKE